MMSGGGEAIVAAEAAAVTKTVEGGFTDDRGLTRVADVGDDEFPGRPVADIEDAVAGPAGLGFARFQHADMLRGAGVGDVDDLDAVLPRGDEGQGAGDTDAGGHLDGIVVAQQLWFVRIGNINEPESILAGGDIGDVVFDKELAGVAQAGEFAERDRFFRLGDVEHVELAATGGIEPVAFNGDGLAGVDAVDLLGSQGGAVGFCWGCGGEGRQGQEATEECEFQEGGVHGSVLCVFL
nr:hypothetical protein [Gimesia panareensis]